MQKHAYCDGDGERVITSALENSSKIILTLSGEIAIPVGKSRLEKNLKGFLTTLYK